MIEFNFKFDGERVFLGLKKLEEGMDPKPLLGILAARQILNIKEGTFKGMDLEGNFFKPSLRALGQGAQKTRGLKSIARRVGVSAGSLASQGRTLIDKGHMLGAVKVVSLDSQRAVLGLGVAIENQKAVWHQYGTRHMVARPWFGMRPGDSKRLEVDANIWADKTAKGSGL